MELRECPFCGGEKIQSKDNSHHLRSGALRMQWRISCNHCCVDMFGGEGHAKTVERWNTRAENKERVE